MIVQFIYNLLTSSNNHLLLQLCRWLALALEQATTKVVTTMTYHHHHHCLRMNSSHSSWVVREQWRKPYASLRRILLAPISNNRGLSQINIVLLRISWTPSLLSSRWPKNRFKRMNGLTPLSKSSVYWVLWNIKRQNMRPINYRDRPGYGGPISCPPYLPTHRSHGSNLS